MSNFDTWEKVQCIVCGNSFFHTTCYKPKTCNSFECVHNYLQDKEFYDNKLKNKGVMPAKNTSTLDNQNW